MGSIIGEPGWPGHKCKTLFEKYLKQKKSLRHGSRGRELAKQAQGPNFKTQNMRQNELFNLPRDAKYTSESCKGAQGFKAGSTAKSAALLWPSPAG
jgi:hypothetical protein